jgi:hypothetical protein
MRGGRGLIPQAEGLGVAVDAINAGYTPIELVT